MARQHPRFREIGELLPDWDDAERKRMSDFRQALADERLELLLSLPIEPVGYDEDGDR